MEKTIWKLMLAYDGADFHGWQVQADRSLTPTIQGTLADAIAQVTGEQILPQGAGRTDAGVHALAQAASFPLSAPIPAENFQRALNRILPVSIRVLSAEPVNPDFHARHSAIGKVYQYRIFHGPLCPPFMARYITLSRWALNLEAMHEAAQKILGEHDFTSFAATDPDRATRSADNSQLEKFNAASEENVRCIDQSDWSLMPSSLDTSAFWPEMDKGSFDAAQIYTYTVRGNGFLHHMVRNLVGTFMEVGRGRIQPGEIERILKGRDRGLAGPTAPAQGLYLKQVLY